jgi:hypothetical protein
MSTVTVERLACRRHDLSLIPFTATDTMPSSRASRLRFTV